MKKAILTVIMVIIGTGFAYGQKVILITPNGGETLTSGTPQLITWSYSGLSGNENLVIALEASTNNIFTEDYNIGTCKVSQRSFEWQAGKILDGTFVKPGSNYSILIEVRENESAYDLSNASFTIAPPVATLALMAPNGGEALRKGMETDINWSFAGKTGFVSLTLLKDDQPLGLIADNLPALNFRYRWRVGTPLLNGVPYPGGGNYRIQILWRPRPSTEKFDTEERKAPGAGLPNVQKNVDRSDGAFSIQETVPDLPQKAKTEKK